MANLIAQYNEVNKKVNKQTILLATLQIMKPISYATYRQQDILNFQMRDQFFKDIQTFWNFNFNNRLGLQISVALTYGKYLLNKYFFHLTDQRLYVQIVNLLKQINLRCPKNIRFKMNNCGTILSKVTLNWDYFLSQYRLFLEGQINKIKDHIYIAITFLQPYLALAPLREQKYKKQININMLQVKQKYQQYKNLRNEHHKNIISLTQSNYDFNSVSKSVSVIKCRLHQINQSYNHNSKYSKDYCQQRILEKKQFPQNSTFQLSDISIDNTNENQTPLLLGIQIIKKTYKSQAKYQGTHSTVQTRKYDYKISYTIHTDKNENNQIKSKTQQVKITGLLACKTCKSNQISQNSLKTEVQFLKYIRNYKCSYIGRYFKQKQNNHSIYIKVYPQNLYDHLIKINKQQTFISSKKKIIMIHQITEAIRFLSLNNACHRDLKQVNIMIPKDRIPKVVDYGSVCSIYGHSQFKNYNKGLLSTDGYYFPYKQCSQQIKQKYNQSQYEQHIFFDSYSLGKIIENIFHQYERSPEWVGHVLIQNISYIVGSCKDEDPVNRLSYQQIQLFLEILYQQLNFQKYSK